VDTLLDMEAVAVRGPFALSCGALNPAEVASDALEQVRGAALHRQITLGAELAPDLPTVTADRQKLTRVLVNLLGNAVKFTRPGGRVTLRTRLCPGWLRFEVIDTGIGIPAAEQETIFREGVCLNAAATSYESVGLGLTFCRRIMEAHGGTIQVTSEPGKGSTFSIALPLGR
jgi:signal transduction histidine kinase